MALVLPANFVASPVNTRKLVYGKKPILTAAMSAFPFSEEIAALFTFNSNFDEKVIGYLREKDSNTIWVPREAVPYADPPNDFRVTTPTNAIDCTIVPRNDEQIPLGNKSLSLLKSGVSHIFEAPTGWGKTVVGGWVAARFGQRTLIVTTKDDLIDQWRIALTQVLGIPTNQVGHIQANVEDWKNKQFVLGMAQSLIIEGKYPLEMFKNFGFLIVDEVHQMAAECFVRVCQSFYAKYRLGFSATPDRRDGKTRLLHWNIGKTLVKGTIQPMRPKILVRQTGWRIPAKRKLVKNAWVYVPIPYAPGRMMLVLKAMSENQARNMEIVNFSKQSFKSGRTTLIMSDLREDHLNRLFQMLTGEGIPGNEIAFYVGGMKKHERELAKKAKVVLATYAMCSTGTDVPIWDTLVMATPRADVKQIVGRVIRFMEGKRQPVVLDLVDRDSIFQNFHLKRQKQYYAIGAKEIVKIS